MPGEAQGERRAPRPAAGQLCTAVVRRRDGCLAPVFLCRSADGYGYSDAENVCFKVRGQAPLAACRGAVWRAGAAAACARPSVPRPALVRSVPRAVAPASTRQPASGAWMGGRLQMPPGRRAQRCGPWGGGEAGRQAAGLLRAGAPTLPTPPPCAARNPRAPCCSALRGTCALIARRLLRRDAAACNALKRWPTQKLPTPSIRCTPINT